MALPKPENPDFGYPIRPLVSRFFPWDTDYILVGYITSPVGSLSIKVMIYDHWINNMNSYIGIRLVVSPGIAP